MKTRAFSDVSLHRFATLVILGLAFAPTALLLPAEPSVPAAYAGTFKCDEFTLELGPPAQHGTTSDVSGHIQFGDQKFPVTARFQNGQVKGAFESGGERFQFTAALEGSVLTFTTENTTYRLKRQAVNPLARRAAPNPLARTPPEAQPATESTQAVLDTTEAVGNATEPVLDTTAQPAAPGTVGLALTARDQNIEIVDVLPGSPAAQAGIRPGGIVRKVNGQSVTAMKLAEAVARIRGEVGTPVTVTIEDQTGRNQEFTLVRVPFHLPTSPDEPAPVTTRSSAVSVRRVSAPATGTIRLKTYSVRDEAGIGGEAFTFLMPVDWKVEGGVQWRAHPAMPAYVAMKVYNPDGPEVLEGFPTLAFSWTEGGIPFFPTGSIYLGNEVRPPVQDPLDYIRQYALPRFRQNVPNPKIVSTEELPEVAQAVAPTVQEPGVQKIVRAGRLRLEYPVDGKEME